MSSLRKVKDAFFRLLDKPTTNDPLYVSNRTTAQKWRTIAFVAGPFLVIAAVVILVQGLKPPAPPPRQLTPAEIAAKMLPDATKVPLESNPDVSVGDVQIEHSARPIVTGTINNTSARVLRKAEVLMWLADEHGSVLGSLTAQAHDVPPHGSAAFRIPLPFKNASIVLVRDVQSESR
jgi:hypothetical protein